DRDRDEPDRQAHPAAVHEPAEHVVPEPVATEKVPAVLVRIDALFDARLAIEADEVPARTDHSEQRVGLSGYEEAHRQPYRGIGDVVPSERHGINVLSHGVHVQAVRRTPARWHRWSVAETRVTPGLRVRREERSKQGKQVQRRQEQGAGECDAVTTKTPPHESRLRQRGFAAWWRRWRGRWG